MVSVKLYHLMPDCYGDFFFSNTLRIFKLQVNQKYSDFSIFLSGLLTFSTANIKLCVLGIIGFIVQ